LFLSIPVGFIIHHIIEKEIYQHSRKDELTKLLTLEENVFSFVYHLVIGIIIITFIKLSIIQGILFFIPMALYTFLSTLPTKTHPSRLKSLFLSSATMIGVVIGLLVGGFIPIWVQSTLIGLITGVLLFAVIRHHIPFGRKGHIGYFTVGFLLYSLLIVLSWNFL
jgi:hypothetical protein